LLKLKSFGIILCDNRKEEKSMVAVYEVNVYIYNRTFDSFWWLYCTRRFL